MSSELHIHPQIIQTPFHILFCNLTLNHLNFFIIIIIISLPDSDW